MNISEAIKTKESLNNENGVAVNIMHTAYVVKSSINSLLKQYALSAEQYNILRILKGAYPNKMCVKQIAERLIERNANVPRTIDKLVIKKLVRRGESLADKRETKIDIAPAGIKMLENINPEINKIAKDICNLNKSEIAQLNALLDKYRTN